MRESGVGKTILIKSDSPTPIKVGVVGLGVGTLAGYGKKDDIYRFYEINPTVIDVAKKHFTFLSKSPSIMEYVLGDARLRLEKEPDQKFDVLVIDAFSGDSVPVHLLTKEAFSHYFRHLKPDGVLALHITNRFLNLKPVMKSAADAFSQAVKVITHEGTAGNDGYRSEWALISKDKNFFKHVLLVNTKDIEAPKDFKLWKDDYSCLISILN